MEKRQKFLENKYKQSNRTKEQNEKTHENKVSNIS